MQRETSHTPGELRSGTAFDDIARRYKKDSLVQKAASELLFDLLQIGPHEDVLDLGCGTGHLTERIRQRTSGSVLGVDPSTEMIAEAEANYGGRIRFAVGAAETLAAREEFDAIFCNSAFQWFRDGPRGLRACHGALRPGGRMAIQAPASWRYCPNFLFALERVASDDATGPIFARFHSPWLFLESPDDYASLFRSAGFEVQLSRFDLTQDLYTPDEVMRVFESGAAAGYFDARNYDAALPPGYTSECTSLLRSSFRDQASDDGLVSLEFNRIFLVARR